MYDSMLNKFKNIVSRDRNISGNDNSSIQLDIFRLIWSEDVWERTISYLKSMNELNIDEATIILLQPLILFSPDRRDIKDRKLVFQIQSKYSFLLKKYMIWKYGKEHTEKIYSKLMLKLMELRRLHEMHSSILLDADPSQLDPFPLALLLNEKEAIQKARSSQTNQELAAASPSTQLQPHQDIPPPAPTRPNHLEDTNTKLKPETDMIATNLSKQQRDSFHSASICVLTPESSISAPSSLQNPSVSSNLSPFNDSYMVSDSDVSTNSVTSASIHY